MKLKIKSVKDGFRRAGFTFSATTETIIDTKDLTKEQVQALKSETMLVVFEVEDDKAAAKLEAAAKAEADKKAKEEAHAKADNK